MENLTTNIETEVLSEITGYKRYNRIKSLSISIEEFNEVIAVVYEDFYKKEGDDTKHFLKTSSYGISPNPGNLPLVAPENDPEAEVFDSATDEYSMWMNGSTGVAIADAVANRVISMNGAPKA